MTYQEKLAELIPLLSPTDLVEVRNIFKKKYHANINVVLALIRNNGVLTYEMKILCRDIVILEKDIPNIQNPYTDPLPGAYEVDQFNAIMDAAAYALAILTGILPPLPLP